MARMANGTIIEDPVRFPSKMSALADAVHARGLRFGLYTSASSLTCQQRPGSYNFEAGDAERYCYYGADYIKVDNCGGARWPRSNTSWIAFRAAIDACHRQVMWQIVRHAARCIIHHVPPAASPAVVCHTPCHVGTRRQRQAAGQSV